MLFNKNNYRKVQTRKTLHKVGKEWKVVSVALLMAIAGGAVATHAANADETNDANNYNVNSLVSQLNTSAVANSPRTNYQASSNATSSSASSSASSIEYYPGNNGSAARYFDKVDGDNAKINQYRPTVNAYVQSLNAEYNPQVRSFATTSNSARNAASNDSKLANSYSAIANKNTTMATVNSLASANHMDPNLYVGMVEDNEQAYSGAVSSASNDVKANQDVASLANSLEGFDFNSAIMSASASDVVANSNFVGAQDNFNSIVNKFKPGTNNSDLATAASELSYGAVELYARGNNTAYSALANSLAEKANNNVNVSSLTADLTSAVNAAYSSASAEYSSSAKNINTLSDYASSAYFNTDNFVTGFTSPTLNNDADGTYNGDFNSAVSAATDIRFAPVLASAANSLFAKYGTQYANYTTRSKEASGAITSAADELTAAHHAMDFASANSNVISSLSQDVAGGRASFAASLLNSSEAVWNFEQDLGMVTINPSAGATYNYSLNATNGDSVAAYLKAVNGGNNTNPTYQVLSAAFAGISAQGNPVNTPSNVSKRFSMFAALIPDNSTMFANDTDAGDITGAGTNATVKNTGNIGTIVNDAKGIQAGNNHTYLTSLLTNGSDALLNKALNQNGTSLTTSTKMSDLDKAVDTIKTDLLNAVNPAANVTTGTTNPANGNGLSATQITKGAPSAEATGNYASDAAALLSAGIDVKSLEANSAAIDNVGTIASTAAKSLDANVNYNTNTSEAEKLNNALGVAASSANSALGSAQSASAEYSSANDEDVTLANFFAGSYASDANKESDIASTASSGLNSFFKDMASDPAFNSADDAYNAAATAATNDYKLGVANAQSIYNSNAHFLDVLKGARLHSTPHFGSKKFGDKVVGSVKAGDRLTVHGVNVSRNGAIHGVTRYYVTDNTTGAKGFFTGQPNYSKPAYLNATAADADVSIKTLKPVNVYSEINGKKAIATVPAGKVLENATVVYDNDSQDAYGFTKVQAANGDFLTANTDYVEILTPTVNTNNNVPQSNFSNFNLNGGQKMADYYNNLSQD